MVNRERMKEIIEGIAKLTGTSDIKRLAAAITWHHEIEAMLEPALKSPEELMEDIGSILWNHTLKNTFIIDCQIIATDIVKYLSTITPAPETVSEDIVVLYHGSPSVIDDTAIASGTFFTDDILVAKDYGQYVYRLTLSGEKIKVLSRDIMQEHWIVRSQVPMSYVDLVIQPTPPTQDNEEVDCGK